MSGYFGALMRSSGMPFAGVPAPTSPAEPAVTEISVERPAVSPVPVTQTMAAQPTTFAPPARVDTTTDPPAPLSASRAHATREAADARPAMAIRAADRSRVAADANADAPEPPARQHVEASKPPLGPELVRAAMRWVAEGARTGQRATEATESTAPRASSTQVATPDGHSRRAPREQGDRAAQPAVTPARIIEADAPARDRVVTPAVPIRSARAALAEPPAWRAADTPDEVVEVSIGAIHVRVDAPAAQTVVQAAAPRTSAERAAAAPSRPSGLSRRALRRI